MREATNLRNSFAKLGYFIVIVIATIYFFTDLSIWNAQSQSILAGMLKVVACLSLFLGTLLCLFVHPKVRSAVATHWRLMPNFWVMLLIVVGRGVLGGAFNDGFETQRETDARAQGYASAGEFGEASAKGFQTAADYHAHLKKIAADAREAVRKKAEYDARYAAAEKLVVGR